MSVRIFYILRVSKVWTSAITKKTLFNTHLCSKFCSQQNKKYKNKHEQGNYGSGEMCVIYIDKIPINNRFFFFQQELWRLVSWCNAEKIKHTTRTWQIWNDCKVKKPVTLYNQIDVWHKHYGIPVQGSMKNQKSDWNRAAVM